MNTVNKYSDVFFIIFFYYNLRVIFGKMNICTPAVKYIKYIYFYFLDRIFRCVVLL